MIENRTSRELSHTLCYGESYENKHIFLKKFWDSKPQYFLNFTSSEKYFREQYGVNLCMTFNKNIETVTVAVIMKDGVLYIQDIIVPASKYAIFSYIQRSRDKFIADIYAAKLKIFLSKDISMNDTLVGILTPYDRYKFKDIELSKFAIGFYHICNNSMVILYGEKFIMGTSNNGYWEEVSCLANDIVSVQRFIINHCSEESKDLYKIFNT